MRYAKNSMKCDVEMMKLRITNFQSKYEAIDETMISEIEANPRKRFQMQHSLNYGRKNAESKKKSLREFGKKRKNGSLK